MSRFFRRQMRWMGGVVLLLMSIMTTAYGQGAHLGDLNCDGVVNQDDIEPFLLAVSDPTAYAAQYPNCDINNADINGDLAVNSLDIPPFFSLLRGPVPAPAVSSAGLIGAILALMLVALTGLRRRAKVSP
jgi:hypothetical protein